MSSRLIETLRINDIVVKPNENCNTLLERDVYRVSVHFNALTNTLTILPCRKDGKRLKPYTYDNVALIRDPSRAPSKENKSISLHCGLLVTNDVTDDITQFVLGPVVRKAENQIISPGKFVLAYAQRNNFDMTLEATAMRALIDTLRLREYIDSGLLSKIQRSLTMSHLIISHMGDAFRIVMIFSVSLTNAEIKQFDPKFYHPRETKKIISSLSGVSLLESFLKHSPSEPDRGWVPSFACIVLDKFLEVARAHYTRLLVEETPSSHSAQLLKNVLQTVIMQTTSQPSKIDMPFVEKNMRPLLYCMLMMELERTMDVPQTSVEASAPSPIESKSKEPPTLPGSKYESPLHGPHTLLDFVPHHIHKGHIEIEFVSPLPRERIVESKEPWIPTKNGSLEKLLHGESSLGDEPRYRAVEVSTPSPALKHESPLDGGRTLGEFIPYFLNQYHTETEPTTRIALRRHTRNGSLDSLANPETGNYSIEKITDNTVSHLVAEDITAIFQETSYIKKFLFWGYANRHRLVTEDYTRKMTIFLQIIKHIENFGFTVLTDPYDLLGHISLFVTDL